jgi:hypothetical protein
MSRQPSLRALVADLRRVTRALERYAAAGDDRALDRQVLDVLADGPASGAAVCRTLRRRRTDVWAVLRLLETAGRVTRDDRSSWRLVDRDDETISR